MGFSEATRPGVQSPSLADQAKDLGPASDNFFALKGIFCPLEVDDLFELVLQPDMCQVMLGSSIINHSLHLQVVSDVNWCREAAAAAVQPTHSRAAALPPEQSNFTQK